MDIRKASQAAGLCNHFVMAPPTGQRAEHPSSRSWLEMEGVHGCF